MSRQIKTDKISNYFKRGYPNRSGFLGRLLFRHGDLDRKQIVRQWIPSMQGISIVDVGCGDGKFLSSIITDCPVKIVIEDISGSAVLAAYENLKGKAVVVEKHECNSLKVDSINFDLVLAVGILDYYSNWEDFIKKLLIRSQGSLIVNLPRIDHPRNWLRFIWFFFHGVQLQMLNRKKLTNVITKLGLPFEIQQSRFEWFVRISKNKGNK